MPAWVLAKLVPWELVFLGVTVIAVAHGLGIDLFTPLVDAAVSFVDGIVNWLTQEVIDNTLSNLW